MKKQRSHKGLFVIALFKLLKGGLLLAVAIGALKLLHKDVELAAEHLIQYLHFDLENHYVHNLLGRLDLVDDHILKRVSVITFGYAALMLTEGVGLLMAKRWAEWLTVAATASFLPWEIYELAQHVNAARIAVLVVNLVILAYLVWVIRRES